MSIMKEMRDKVMLILVDKEKKYSKPLKHYDQALDIMDVFREGMELMATEMALSNIRNVMWPKDDYDYED